ncbi:hypothetical protein SGFS_060110 [Streptomyces graminofaciens]|uniref:Uncharacterized protein n=1 Tax=Streptomyces graminofaciens TaxID=68212 RepID=A0ABM7FCE8_9ACTN|nr:hypothetical protein SGFS_060110 [Streptomyces graminofaciens]
MGVIDPQGLLTDEAQQSVRVALLKDLGGHIPAAPVVPGAPDRADSPAPDRVDQFVPAGEDLTHGCASFPLRLPPRLTVGGEDAVPAVLRGADFRYPRFPAERASVTSALPVTEVCPSGPSFSWVPVQVVRSPFALSSPVARSPNPLR